MKIISLFLILGACSEQKEPEVLRSRYCTEYVYENGAKAKVCVPKKERHNAKENCK